MEGEKLTIFGLQYTHYEKRIKSPYFEPKLNDIKAINRPYWYNYKQYIFLVKINF